jgi:hypothetical protein
MLEQDEGLRAVSDNLIPLSLLGLLFLSVCTAKADRKD